MMGGPGKRKSAAQLKAEQSAKKTARAVWKLYWRKIKKGAPRRSKKR